MAFNLGDVELGKLDRVELENMIEKLAEENTQLESELETLKASVGDGEQFAPAQHDTSSLAEAALWASGYFAAAEEAAQKFLSDVKEKAEATSKEMMNEVNARAAELESRRAEVEAQASEAQAAADELLGTAQAAAGELLTQAETSSNEMLAKAKEETEALRAQAQELYAKTKALCQQMIEQVKQQANK